MIEHIDNYSQTSGILWQFCRDELASDANGTIVDFNAANSITDLFKIKEKMTGQTGNNGTKDVETMVSLKYLSNFWKTLEKSLINCKINFDLNWSKNCVIISTAVAVQDATFWTTDTKLLIPVVTLKE